MGTPVREGAGLAKFCISEALVQKITIVDFSSAWVMKDVFQIARAKPGWISAGDISRGSAGPTSRLAHGREVRGRPLR